MGDMQKRLLLQNLQSDLFQIWYGPAPWQYLKSDWSGILIRFQIRFLWIILFYIMGDIQKCLLLQNLQSDLFQIWYGASLWQYLKSDCSGILIRIQIRFLWIILFYNFSFTTTNSTPKITVGFVSNLVWSCPMTIPKKWLKRNFDPDLTYGSS